MGTDRMKKAAEWFYGSVYFDEVIRPRAEKPVEKLPSLLRTARSLENHNGWQSRESTFYKQAKLLVNYEDDFAFSGSVVRYYPTYQSLTDTELRGYFGWRTKLRRGQLERTSTSFAFLYIYELLNGIGWEDAMDGYWKLREFRDSYGTLDESILPYLGRWMRDFVIYYDLNPALLADSIQVLRDQSITILEHLREQEPEKVIWAVSQLAPKWLDRSKFYAEHRSDMDAVLYRVLCRMAEHYDTRCKKTMVEQFFGPRNTYQVNLFETAVFADPLKNRSFDFCLDERCIYTCRHGLWSVTKHAAPPRPNAKLEGIIKTVDGVMREAFSYGRPIKPGTDVKWILKIIQAEVDDLLRRQKEAEAKKITIDASHLAKIRAEAAVTRDKLITEEDVDFGPEIAPEITPEITTAEIPAGASPRPTENDSPLSDAEYRLLQCLLYGGNLSWVRAEGHILSVLSDSINDKLYETFLDTVMDDSPALVEDYIDDLKEMIHP